MGRYRILGKLGRGGMGSVWKAWDERLARAVALKLLPEELAISAQARRRFVREARAASRLNHPGISTVHDFGETDERLYIVTAFVDGFTLSEKLRGGPLPIGEAVRITCAVAEALQHAHEHGVIHRDISSANIMLGRDGHVTVIDFGLARLRREVSTRLTPPGATVGTAPYIAPEVIQDREAGPRTDVYALGVVLYEMLTGAPPFEGQALEAVLNATLNQRPEPPSQRRPDVPSKLDRIVLKALAKEPVRRYPSAAAMVRDLEGLALQQAASAPAPRVASRRPADKQQSAPAEPPASKLVAVLPFRDASPMGKRPARAQEFARGLAETVSARLARVTGVHVIPPSALPSRKRSRTDLMRVGQEVGASLMLCGSVQRVGPQIRIGFSLVGPQRVQLAGDTVDGAMRDILDLEDQLVRRIARSLELETPSLPTLRKEELRDPAAHEHYLQALGYLQRYENEASVDGAIGLLEKLVESDGRSARVHAVLGRAYLAKYRLTFEREWEGRAAAACKIALKLDPDLPEVLVTLGNLHRETGRYKNAVREYQRAMALRPDDPETLVDLAWAYERVGKVEMAEKALQEAIALRPSYWRSYNHLGGLHFRQAQYEEAAKVWERVVELAPDNARGHSNLAAAFYHLGRYDDALAAYNHSLEIRPAATAYTSLGTVYFFLGHRERAIEALEKAKALRPKNPLVWGNLADAYRWTPGLEEKAVFAFDQAIALKRRQLEINRRHGKGWAHLATWLAKRARFEEALRAIRRGLDLSPHDVNCMALAVRVFHLAGDRVAALQWLERAVWNGYDVAEFERDPELATLREDARFQRIVKGRRAPTPGT